KRALAINEKTLGTDHPDVALSLNNLALLYFAQGQYAQAEPLYNRALGILEKTVPNHPNLAALLDNLADLYTNMGRGDEAKKLLDRARRIRAKR
ncbi:MAG: tetratricopeptide repeat protein, partial [bacterium]|nr:tetratricopeptide repeat protein [bacterium]